MHTALASHRSRLTTIFTAAFSRPATPGTRSRTCFTPAGKAVLAVRYPASMTRALPMLVAALSLAACAAPSEERAAIVVVAPTTSAPRPVETAVPEAKTPRAADVVTGIGTLHVGQSVAEVRDLLGPEVEHVDFAEEKRRYESTSLDTSKHAMFHIGFDEVLYYGAGRDSIAVTPPVWKVYARAGRTILLKFVQTGAVRAKDEKIGVPPSCFLGATEAEMKATLGDPPYRTTRPASSDVAFHYPGRGVSVIVSGGKLIVLDIYGELEPRARDVFTGALVAQ
jgi:hypothetical protein